MKSIAKLLKKNNNQQPNTNQPNPPVFNVSPEGSEEKENILFEVAVMGYTLKSNLYEQYEEKETAFLNQIKRDNNASDSYISKTYTDMAKEAKVTIDLFSDMDPFKRYECSRPNGISLRSNACIIFYDPTHAECLSNLESYFYNLVSSRIRFDSGDAIMCFVGINGDKPEEHKFKKSDILSAMEQHYDKDKISIYSVSLNPSLNCTENVENIIKNLAIACLKNYQKSDELFEITSAESKPLPLSLPKPWETPYSFYTTLREANKKPKEIFGNYLPEELINYMTKLFIKSIFQEYEKPELQFSIYKELFMEETAYLWEKLLIIANSPKQLMDKGKDTSEKVSITSDDKPQKSRETCLMM